MKSIAGQRQVLSAFEQRRRAIGLFLGPILFFILVFIDTPTDFITLAQKSFNTTFASPDVLEVAYGTKIVLGLALLMITWWITEAVPIPLTALLPGIILPLFHVGGASASHLYPFDAKNVLVNYAHPIIFLFLGGFLIAIAMQKWKLNRRFTLFILTRGNVAANSRYVLLGIMSITAFLSMWINNTAATAMMLPIALGVATQNGAKPGESHFGTALMLGTAWSASIGGVGTIIGTAPNGICVSILKNLHLAEITFVDWITFGLPYVIVTIPVAWIILLKLFPPEMKGIEGGKQLLQRYRSELGAWSRGEIASVTAFCVAVVLWITNPFWKYILPSAMSERLAWFDEYVIAMFAALLLFVFPIDWKNKKFALDWNDAGAIDWGTLLLFGGGIALSDAMFKTGLAAWIATSFMGIVGQPSTLVLMILIVLLIDFMTEVTSNTAVTSMMVPIVISIAQGSGANPVALSIAAAVAASMAFMLPVATPPNALVYGTGHIRITQMVKAGFILDVVGWIVTIVVMYLFAHKIFGVFGM